MMSSTKVLVQPPYREGVCLSYAEADARLLFFKTYFDVVFAFALNPARPQPLLLSTLLEQELVQRKEIGVAQFGMVNINGRMDGVVLDQMAASMLQELNHQGSGGFALARSPHTADMFAGTAQDRAVLVLERALPVPHHATPPDQILAFKSGHAAELQVFHKAIDDLYYGLGNRPAEQLLARFEEELRANVEATVKAYEAAGIRSYIGMLKIFLQLSAPVAGAVIAQVAQLPAVVGGAIGGGASMAIQRTKFPLADNVAPKAFQYVLSGLVEGHSRAFPLEPRLDEFDVKGLLISSSRLRTGYPSTPGPPAGIDTCSIVNCISN